MRIIGGCFFNIRKVRARAFLKYVRSKYTAAAGSCLEEEEEREKERERERYENLLLACFYAE